MRIHYEKKQEETQKQQKVAKQSKQNKPQINPTYTTKMKPPQN